MRKTPCRMATIAPVEIDMAKYTGIWPYDVDFRTMNYAQPNPYNAWGEWDNPKHGGCLLGLNPYFGKKIRLPHPYGYTIHCRVGDGPACSLYGNVWCYNNWQTMITDMMYRAGCYLLMFSGMSKDAIYSIFTKSPIPLPGREVGRDGVVLWKYDRDDMNVEISVARLSDWYNGN